MPPKKRGVASAPSQRPTKRNEPLLSRAPPKRNEPLLGRARSPSDECDDDASGDDSGDDSARGDANHKSKKVKTLLHGDSDDSSSSDDSRTPKGRRAVSGEDLGMAQISRSSGKSDVSTPASRLGKGASSSNASSTNLPLLGKSPVPPVRALSNRPAPKRWREETGSEPPSKIPTLGSTEGEEEGEEDGNEPREPSSDAELLELVEYLFHQAVAFSGPSLVDIYRSVAANYGWDAGEMQKRGRKQMRETIKSRVTELKEQAKAQMKDRLSCSRVEFTLGPGDPGIFLYAGEGTCRVLDIKEGREADWVKKGRRALLTKEEIRDLDDRAVLPAKCHECCDCGDVHSDSDGPFCIKCDDCREWFDVVEECVNASESAASEDDFFWTCQQCRFDGGEDDTAVDANAAEGASLRESDGEDVDEDSEGSSFGGDGQNVDFGNDTHAFDNGDHGDHDDANGDDEGDGDEDDDGGDEGNDEGDDDGDGDDEDDDGDDDGDGDESEDGSANDDAGRQRRRFRTPGPSCSLQFLDETESEPQQPSPFCSLQFLDG